MPPRRVARSRSLLFALIGLVSVSGVGGAIAQIVSRSNQTPAAERRHERQTEVAGTPDAHTRPPPPAEPVPTRAPIVGAPLVTPGEARVLKVKGNRIVDGLGRPVRLLGVNRSGAEYACIQGWGIFDGPTDDASVQAMSSWHLNAVRIPLNEHCWLGIGVEPEFGGGAYQQAVTAYVDTVNRAGLVAVLDLHWSAPAGRTADRTQRMADADHALRFWASVAEHFRDRPGVVFDLFNEPHGISWQCWLEGCTVPGGWRTAGMQSLVDAVRGAGASQLIVATGLDYGNDLSQWLAHRPVDPVGNTVAGVHMYNFNDCNTTRCWDRTIAPVAREVPVVTTESGQDDCESDFITAYMRWADRLGVSYLGWTWNTWHCSDGPALIRTYGGEPTNFGAGVRDHLASLAAKAPPAG